MQRLLKRAGPALRWLKPYPFEIYTFAVAAVTIVWLRALGLRLDWQTFDWTLRPLFRSIPRLLLLGIGLQLVWQAGHAALARRLDPLRSYLQQIARPGWLGLWLRLLIAYGLTNYVYFWIKVSVPLLNSRLWDAELWRLDRLLHLGISPSVFLVELFDETPLVPLLDAWYGIWIPSVMAIIAFFVCLARADQRRSFMFSCCFLWTAGALLYLAFPTLGPTYTNREVFVHVLDEMPGATGGQAALLENYQKVLAGRSGVLKSFNPTRGIAALPSLHVAGHFLFMLWARRFARPLYTPLLVATLLTFLGSVVSGWHYAVDGYLGMLLAYLAYRLALRFEPVEETATAPAPKAAGDGEPIAVTHA